MTSEHDGYLFDLDGVLWAGNRVLPGAAEVLETLRGRGKQVRFVSNTSSLSREGCLGKFKRLGISAHTSELFVASELAAEYLARRRPGGTVLLLGNPGLERQLTNCGLKVLHSLAALQSPIDYVVVGRDNALSHQKLTDALRAILDGASWLAVNRDPTTPTDHGLEPGAGAVAAAVEAMTGRPPEATVGKPGTLLLELAVASTSLPPQACVMIGDTLETDIVAGRQLGLYTILVRSGNPLRGDMEAHREPDRLITSLTELLE